MTAVIVLGPSGLATARRVRDALPGAALHGFGPRVAEGAVAFAEVGAHLRALFASGTPIVGVCAAGVLIRACAPLLADKEAEPPVVAVAEDGSVAVPLLGGHRGANELARRVAAALGGVAAITTAGDLRLGFALDDPPPGWRLADAAAVKPVTAALLAGEPVGLAVETAEADCAWLRRAPFAADGPVRLRVTDRAVAGASDTVVLHPATLAVGVGCERGAPADDLVALVRRALAEAGLAAGSVACVASIALKAAEPAVHEAAAALGVPARFFDAAALAAETPRLANPSDLVFRETGCYGVAEGAALAAAGPAATLVVAKTRSARATCAVARSPRVIDAAAVGRARGRLCIVGIGPGEAAGRTAEAEAALAAATDLVGYRLYLDLLGGLAAGKARHGFELGEEDARARLALDLAAAGRSVALVSSGDPGVYAMASLVFELVERAALSLSKGADDPGWARVELVVLPGVSAMQVAAARRGGRACGGAAGRGGVPLGHDFCAISLSDLLTPWAAIERRLRAAAAGDFVVALYNPVSRRRRTQLGLARDILLAARPAGTPVVIARNLGRAGETVAVATLGSLDPEAVDMLSLVLVGSGTTRTVARPDGGVWVYTPRGYESSVVSHQSSVVSLSTLTDD